MSLLHKVTKSVKPIVTGHWFVVTLRFADGTIYILVADSPDGAVNMVNQGDGPPETRQRLPVELVAAEEFMNIDDATNRAARLRQLK